MEREIYSIAFNKSFTEKGEARATVYELGIVSKHKFKIPERISMQGEYVLVEFTDQSRHLLPLKGVELFDRIIKPVEEKEKADTEAVRQQ